MQFGLRELLILVTVFSVWLGRHVHLARMQANGVQAIREFGGWVRYDFQFPSGRFVPHLDFDPKAKSSMPRWVLDTFGVDMFHTVVQVNLNYNDAGGIREENDNLSEDAIQHLPKFPELRVLLLQDQQISDRTMVHLSRLKRLQHLYMWDVSEVSDVGVGHLSRLNDLRYVHIANAGITDSSLVVLSKLKKLEGLSLYGNNFSDRGVAHLVDLPLLEELWLNGGNTTLTDRGMSSIGKMHQLETLSVQGAEITDSGILELSSLRRLKKLNLSSNQATRQGLNELKDELPLATCELYQETTNSEGRVIWVRAK